MSLQDNDEYEWFECNDSFTDDNNDAASTPQSSPTTSSTTHQRSESQSDVDRLESGALATCTSYPVHRAAFDNDAARVRELLKGMPTDDWLQYDNHGNTVLHIAVLNRSHYTVRVLVAMGFPLNAKNARGWTALDEAISMRDRTAAGELFAAEKAAFKVVLKNKKEQLKQTLHDMPDCSLQVKWELGSALFGLLLRRVAPHDTYTLYKYKTMLRVDGSLMGISNLDEDNDDTASFLPEWKRGHFSLVLDTATAPFSMQFIDHKKRTFVDLTEAMKKEKPTLSEQIDAIVDAGCIKTKFRTSEVRFKSLKSWFGNELREKVEGWDTQVYECSGKLQAVTRSKAPIHIAKDATFDDYLAMHVQDDEVEDLSMDLMSMGQQLDKNKSKSKGRNGKNGAATGPAGAPGPPEGIVDPATVLQSSKKKTGSKYRRFSGRCWMASNFPLSLQQLIPLLDVVGNTNRHIAKVAKFLTKYGKLDLFPVKMQIPLIFTVYLLITVSHFKLLQPGDAAADIAFFKVPEGFTRKELNQPKHKKNNSLTML